MSLTVDEKKALAPIVERHAKLNAEIQAKKWEQKELEESAWEKAGVDAKCVKQLSKESAWDDVKREKQRQFEEKMDHCRVALGMLLDTPLGQAAEQAESEETSHDADEQQHNGKGSAKAQRKSGRAKRPEVAATH